MQAEGGLLSGEAFVLGGFCPGGFCQGGGASVRVAYVRGGLMSYTRAGAFRTFSSDSIIILYYAQSSTIKHSDEIKNTVILKYNNTVKYNKIVASFAR